MPSPLHTVQGVAIFCMACAFTAAPALAQTFTRATTTFSAGFLAPKASVAFGNGTFVALGLKGRTPPFVLVNSLAVHTSADGHVWTERVIDIPNVSVSDHGVVRFIGGQFIFTGRTSSASYVARSADGISWTVTNPAAGLPPASGFQEIVTGAGTSLGIFGTTLSASTDSGTNWTERTTPGTVSTAPYFDLTYGAGRFVLVATGTSTRVWTSPDASTWTEILAGQQSSGRVIYGNGIFVLTGTNYKTSTDGVTFTVRPTPANFTLTGTVPLYFLAGRFLQFQFQFISLRAEPVRLAGSTDGLAWSQFATFASDLAPFAPLGFAEGNNRIVAVGFDLLGDLVNPVRPAVVAVLDTSNLPTPPNITTQPAPQNAVAGGTATFTVAVSGTGNTFQWRKDNVAIAGSTAATLTLTGVTIANVGTYSVIVTNAIGSTPSTGAALALVTASNVGRLINMSIRTGAGTGDSTLIVGVGLGGAGATGTKAVLIRAVGPTLTAFGVPGALADPVMTAFAGQTQIAQNDDWAGGFDFATVGAFVFSGAAPRDAAIYNAAIPLASYTIQIVGKNNGTGIALAEIYDATPASGFSAATPRLVNVSARTQVGTGDSILIAGFVVGGATPVRVLIRAVGPTLTGFGVGGVLVDPKLEVFQATTKITDNDNWLAADAPTFASVGAFALTAGSRDAALVTTLPPGSYTAQVSGVGSTTGVALVEVYELP